MTYNDIKMPTLGNRNTPLESQSDRVLLYNLQKDVQSDASRECCAREDNTDCNYSGSSISVLRDNDDNTHVSTRVSRYAIENRGGNYDFLGTADVRGEFYDNTNSAGAPTEAFAAAIRYAHNPTEAGVDAVNDILQHNGAQAAHTEVAAQRAPGK